MAIDECMTICMLGGTEAEAKVLVESATHRLRKVPSHSWMHALVLPRNPAQVRGCHRGHAWKTGRMGACLAEELPTGITHIGCGKKTHRGVIYTHAVRTAHLSVCGDYRHCYI